MTRANIAKYFFGRSTLSLTGSNTFQAAPHLDRPRLLDAFLGRLKAFQQGLRKQRPLGLVESESLVGQLVDGGSHTPSFASQGESVKQPDFWVVPY